MRLYKHITTNEWFNIDSMVRIEWGWQLENQTNYYTLHFPDKRCVCIADHELLKLYPDIFNQIKEEASK